MPTFVFANKVAQNGLLCPGANENAIVNREEVNGH